MKLVLLFTAILAISATFVPKHRMSVQNLKQAIMMLQTSYEIDNVVNVLQSLYSVQNDNLQDLYNNWATSSSTLQGAIDELSTILDDQNRDCQAISVQSSTAQRNRETYVGHIEESKASISTNLDSINSRTQLRCDSNQVFLQRVLESKKTLGFLSYLKTRLNDPAFHDYLTSQLESLAQVTLTKTNIISFLAKHHLKSLIQNRMVQDLDVFFQQDSIEQSSEEATQPEEPEHSEVKARTDEEIGTGHIDNTKGELGLDKYTRPEGLNADVFIAQANELLDSLIAGLRSDIENLLDNEARAFEAFEKYIAELKRENDVLQHYIEIWTNEIANLDETIGIAEENIAKCTAKADELAADLASKEAQFSELEHNFETSKSSLRNTISLLENVIDLYINKVVNAAPVYKKRVDDYLSGHRAVQPAPAEESEESEEEEHSEHPAAGGDEESSHEETSVEASEEETAEEGSASEEPVEEVSSESSGAEEESSEGDNVEEEVAEESSEEDVEVSEESASTEEVPEEESSEEDVADEPSSEGEVPEESSSTEEEVSESSEEVVEESSEEVVSESSEEVVEEESSEEVVEESSEDVVSESSEEVVEESSEEVVSESSEEVVEEESSEEVVEDESSEEEEESASDLAPQETVQTPDEQDPEPAPIPDGPASLPVAGADAQPAADPIVLMSQGTAKDARGFLN